MDGSTIHTEKKVYEQYFQKENFIKGADPTKTMLLHLAEPEGISVDADELKDCLIKSIKLIEPYCSFEEVMKKFVSICTDGANKGMHFKDVLLVQ